MAIRNEEQIITTMEESIRRNTGVNNGDYVFEEYDNEDEGTDGSEEEDDDVYFNNDQGFQACNCEDCARKRNETPLGNELTKEEM